MRGGEMGEMCDLAAAILLRCGVSSQDENNGPDNIDLGSPSDLLAADTLHSVESETWEEEEEEEEEGGGLSVGVNANLAVGVSSA